MNRLLYLAALVAVALAAYFGVRSCAAPPATNAPLKLQSLAGTTNAPPPTERIPVYVIPEAIVVATPIGQIVFAAQAHVEELARKFPSTRVTNVVIWSRP